MRVPRTLALCLLLAGCTHVSTRRVGVADNGAPIYRITCTRDMDACYDRASELCPGGFVPMQSGGGNSYAVGQNAWTGDPMLVRRYDGELILRCQNVRRRRKHVDLSSDEAAFQR